MGPVRSTPQVRHRAGLKPTSPHVSSNVLSLTAPAVSALQSSGVYEVPPDALLKVPIVTLTTAAVRSSAWEGETALGQAARRTGPTAALLCRSEHAKSQHQCSEPPLQMMSTSFSPPLTRVGKQSWRGCAPNTQQHSTEEDNAPLR